MTNAEAWFNIALRPRKPEGSLGRTAQDGHLDSHTAPELCYVGPVAASYVVTNGASCVFHMQSPLNGVSCDVASHETLNAAKHTCTLMYLALHEVKWCMVVWRTQNAPRRQQFLVAPAMSAL